MSELHNRLAHLVNYSSQLIFVSGDSVADQQRTLNDFLSQQQDNTEVSFFSAQPQPQSSPQTSQGTQAQHKAQCAADFRGMICRQLAGHTVGSFVRPLNQLLIDLPADNGPYLVCITQAEQLDNQFLQELWDWVMHAQQYNRKLHLNIILFGQSSWAQASQEWLPSQNSHKPVLLSSESVDPVGFDVNALEALMAQDKRWFSSKSAPIVTTKWFISSVLGIFLCVFIGMLSWQYPQEISDLLAGQLPKEKALPAFNINEADINKEMVLAEPQLLAPPANVEQNDALKHIEIVANNSITDTLLVSNWGEPTGSSSTDTNTELEKADEDNESLSRANEDEAIDNNAPALIDAKMNTDTSSKNERILSLPPALSNTPASNDIDFQVPDIISVEQLDATFDAQRAKPFETKPIPALTASQITQKPVKLPLNSAITIDYRFDETTLLALPTDAIVLQLSGIQNPVVLENYLNNNNLKTKTWVYETQRYGGPWYVVVYRQSFNSIDAALNQLSSLPNNLRDTQPFAKSINQIQQEIQQR